jgi:type II secretory pathway pseudopilin PulG
MPARLTSPRGLSLIEATIVLLMISILTAAAAPAAKRTLDQARLTRALSDEAAIKTAIVNFLTDTGFNGFSTSGASVATGNAAVVETLVSDGDIPACNTTTAAFGCTAAGAAPLWAAGSPLWNNQVSNVNGLTDFLERHLVTNNPIGSAANDYPVTGGSPWKGAYINAPVDPDPWGSRYAVNVKWLNVDSACGTRSNDVFVLSAGPDQEIATPYRSDVAAGAVSCAAGAAGTSGAYPVADDLISVIRRDPGETTP